MSKSSTPMRVGVYVDTANIYSNGGSRMQYDVLRDFACRSDGVPVRLNAYVTYDTVRAEEDDEYRRGAQGFHAALRSFGYKVIIKPVKWYTNADNVRWGKANADLDLAVDALLQSDNLDRVLLATGDGDFTRVIQALQNKGCRVEVVAFDNISGRLREEADMFMSGYLIPNLSNPPESEAYWGKLDSVVRGYCYYYNPERGFGYLRYINRISEELWYAKNNGNGGNHGAYGTAFFHFSELSDTSLQNRLPDHNLIFEFTLRESDHQRGGFVGQNIRLVSQL